VTLDASLDTPVQSRIVHSFPDAELERQWRSFLLAADYATHYVAPEFFHEPFFAHKKPFAILVTRGSAIVAVLTGMHEGKQVVCGVGGRPQIAFVPPMTGAVEGAMIEALRREAERSELIALTTWSAIPGFKDRGFVERTIDAIMTLDLTRGPEALRKEFNKGRKSDITFAQKAGVTVRDWESEDEFRQYYDIYTDWCRRKEIDVTPFDVMRAAFGLRQSRRLFLAFHEGKVVAGSVVRYVPSGVAEYSANNSTPSALNLRPNSLLNWIAIQWAHAQGMKIYSMGGSHPFLRHFGGSEISIYHYRIDLTLFRRHDRVDWAKAKLRGVARAVRQRLKQKPAATPKTNQAGR
jgi:hypothetical protein